MIKLDWYIIRKFLGTYALLILLVMSIAIVFDITEKMDDFYDSQLGWVEIIKQYYIAFIPYYLNMFSSLFIFIAVIFFTSKLAGNSEVIAMFAAGMSYHRFVRPYLICASLLAVLTYWLAGWIIPPANEKILVFTDKYVEHFSKEHARNVQIQISPGRVLYMESFQLRTGIGYRASIEEFEGKTLKSRISADRIRYDSVGCWHVEQYVLREFDDLKETLSSGTKLDLKIPLEPEELFYTSQNAEMMTNPELDAYIERQLARGAGNVQAFVTERHKRRAAPIGAFVMTLLGVTMSSKKVRGGMGKNLGLGVVLTAIYILFSTVSTTFAVRGVMTSFMAAWLPNFVFLTIAAYLYRKVSR